MASPPNPSFWSHSLDIHNKEWLQKEGFGGVIGVSQGSAKEPYLLVGEYNKSAKFKVSIIGKGVLFVKPPLGRALIEDSLLRFLLKKDYELEAGNEYKFTISAKF